MSLSRNNWIKISKIYVLYVEIVLEDDVNAD